MILRGEKLEEYREIKPYYNSRLKKHIGAIGYWPRIILRNGYSSTSSQITCICSVKIGQGKEEWGAEPNKEYYILEILEVER